MREYFVSAVENKKVALVAGPFDDHESALAALPNVRKQMSKVNPWSDFWFWGTCSRDKKTKTLFDFCLNRA